MFNKQANTNFVLPSLRRIRQRFEVPPEINVTEAIDEQWEKLRDTLNVESGARIAVGVGSRGIANIVEVVRSVVDKLKAIGCKPFVTPAMGSHGGATAEGQIRVLCHRGITADSVGVPVQATMDVQTMGDVDGIPLFLDRLAYEADGIVLINRIKLHTDFTGPTESGLLKMMAIGLGNQIGADHYHRSAVVRDMYEIFSKVGTALINRTNFLFGVGLIESQDHRTADLKMIPADRVPAAESELLEKSKRYFPRLPVDEADLLIIDYIGKEISGAGMDPNVTGRVVAAVSQQPPSPKITRIFVRDLTDDSEGNAIGIGEADFTTQRLVKKIDIEATAINCVTSCAPESGRIPLAYPNDREAIVAALTTIRPCNPEEVKIVHIKNTLELDSLLVSKGCLTCLEGRPSIQIEPEDLQFTFDSSDNLVSVFN